MKVTVFGATGAIGSLIVASLLDTGVSVTAYVRSPSKVPSDWPAKGALIVEGSMSEPHKIEQAIASADAVINAAGPSMEKTATGYPLVDGVRHILAAMAKHNVTRYIGHATPSVKDLQESLTWDSRLIGFLGRRLFPRGYRELVDMTDLVIKDPRVEWTIIRFIAPNNKPRAGPKSGFFGSDRVRWAVSRADIAEFTVQQLHNKNYIRRMPVVFS